MLLIRSGMSKRFDKIMFNYFVPLLMPFYIKKRRDTDV